MRRRIVIVDPYSSGVHLAPAFRARGFATCAIQTLGEMDPRIRASFQPGDFDVQLTGDTHSVAACLRGYLPEVVLPGAECGVEMADDLNKTLGVRWNDQDTSASRRNKGLMADVIGNAGMRRVKQAYANTSQEAIQVAERIGLPVVIKPLSSAGSDGVALCHDIDRVRNHSDSLLKSRDLFGAQNKQVLVQEYLRGTEWVVDSVSRDGEHKIIAMWEYDKQSVNNSDFVYHAMKIRSSRGETQAVLKPYVRGVLDALGIRNGASHTEVMVTVTGPCLIECGARMHGGKGTIISGLCIGYNQVSALVDSIEGEAAWMRIPEEYGELERVAWEMFLVSSQEGTLRSAPAIEEIRRLKSVHEIALYAVTGDRLKKTTDLLSSPGRVILINSTEELVEAAYSKARAIEEKLGYVVDD